LSDRLELLRDPNRLAALKKRADTLKQALNDFKAVKMSNEEQSGKSKEQKIDKMFEMMERWDQVSPSLPVIVNRLKALKDLQQESTSLNDKVNNLTSQQQSIAQNLGKHTTTLQQINQTLVANSKTMQANVQSIEQKISQLQQQVQKT